MKPPSNIQGPVGIIYELFRKSKVSSGPYLGLTPEHKATVRQWLEYNSLYLLGNPLPSPNILRVSNPSVIKRLEA